MKLRLTATAITMGVFFMVSVTGLLLFAEWAPGGVRATHEWTGILFAAAGLLHLFTHKRAIYRYFHGTYGLVTAVSILAGVLVFYNAHGDS